MGNLKLLLVDEPTEGLAPLMADVVVNTLHDINETGCSILIVEQAIDVALELASLAYVMSKGSIVFQGTPDDLHTTDEIRKKYLEV